MSGHGSASPEVMRPSLGFPAKARASQLQYQSPQESNNPNSYSPQTNASSGTYSGGQSTNGGDYKFQRTNSDHFNRDSSATPNRGLQRHSSFGHTDANKPGFSQPLQTNVGPYGLPSSGHPNYSNHTQSPSPFVPAQNFPPFSLPPSSFSNAPTASGSTRESEHSYPTSMSTDYPSESIHHQQSGPDMMMLDQMTAPNTMPVFGGEGYNRSPFAIPEDFVAYLFSNQQIESPVGMQQGHTK